MECIPQVEKQIVSPLCTYMGGEVHSSYLQKMSCVVLLQRFVFLLHSTVTCLYSVALPDLALCQQWQQSGKKSGLTWWPTSWNNLKNQNLQSLWIKIIFSYLHFMFKEVHEYYFGEISSDTSSWIHENYFAANYWNDANYLEKKQVSSICKGFTVFLNTF